MRPSPLVLAVLSLCLGSIGSGASPTSAAEPTFNRDIAPLVFQHCTACHRAGEVAPFPLLTYRDVQKRSKQIVDVTSRKFMPPWKPLAGHGEFVGERRLSPAELKLLADWAAAGAPEGDPQDLPKPPTFTSGWQLGKPDIELVMGETADVPAEGRDIYRNFVLPVEIPAGKFVKAVEYRPQNRRVVHHAALAIDLPGTARALDQADPGPGFQGRLTIPGRLLPGSLAAWTPGRDAMPLPDGLSLPWPRDLGGSRSADLILQLHLHPSGKAETERSSVGIYLTDEPPARSMADVVLIDKNIDIPPGQKVYRTRDAWTLQVAADLYGLFPHMHLLGRSVKVTAYPPGLPAVPILFIDDWDFAWQAFYQCREPVRLPAGAKIEMECVHDNSAENARNPRQPPERVTWGEQTGDEMSAVILQLVPATEGEFGRLVGEGRRIVGRITAGPADGAADSAEAARKSAREALTRFDRDKNGTLSLTEVSAAAALVSPQAKDQAAGHFKKFDANGDEQLDQAELAKAIQALSR